MTRGLLAYNPAAGRFPSRLIAERAANILRKYGWQIALVQTRDSDHIAGLARQAADQCLDALFIAGGDGSVNQALPGLVGTEVALGVLPAGTANVWAQELGLASLTLTRQNALEESAHKLAQAPAHLVDVGLCSGRPFLLWGGVGLDAFIVHRIEPRSRLVKRFSVVHYVASAVWHASSWRGMNLRVEVNGALLSGHYLLALASNVHLYAGGIAELSPEARLDDGEMDLWLFEGDTLGDTVQVALELLNGQHTISEHVHRIPIHQVLLESGSPMFVQVDGEPVELQGSLVIEVRPKALKVLAPVDAPHSLFVEN